MGQAFDPAFEEGLDLLGAEAVTDLLQRLRVITGEKAVVELGEIDAAASELRLGPVVAVKPDLDAEGYVRRACFMTRSWRSEPGGSTT
jgi:hypothetical protein